MDRVPLSIKMRLEHRVLAFIPSSNHTEEGSFNYETSEKQ